ncbi:MAG: cysteine dioxygenase, partial [Alphaproteobacteria bacterium]
MPTIAEERRAAVAETIAGIREIEARKGVTREALEEIKAAMIGLARRTELFPRAVFAPPGGEPRGRLYRISEDPDHRFALYLNAAKPG